MQCIRNLLVDYRRSAAAILQTISSLETNTAVKAAFIKHLSGREGGSLGSTDVACNFTIHYLTLSTVYCDFAPNQGLY